MTQRVVTHRPRSGSQDKIHHFKLVLLGGTDVGKSSLVLRFVNGRFDQYQGCTVGAAFQKGTVSLEDTTVTFDIWDTAGQERFMSIAPMYYRGAQAAIVVYDITNQNSLDRAKTWINILQQQVSPNIVIALTGNKADLADMRTVDYREVQAYAEENCLLFMETSAKNDINVSDIFLEIAKKLPKSNNNASEIRLSSHQPIQEANKCCK